MLCKVCGAQIPDDAKECEFCGAKTNAEETADAVSEETKIINSEEIEKQINAGENASEESSSNEIFDDNEKRRREQMKKMLEDKKQQLSEIERRRNEKRRKQRRNRIMLISAICALAVAAAGIGVYYVAQNVNSTVLVDESPAPTMAAANTTVPTEIPTIAPSPELSMETENGDANTSGSNAGQSWTSTGNTGSGASSSSGTSTSGGSGVSASAGSSSGGVSSNKTVSSSSGSSSGSASSGSTAASGNSTSAAAVSNSGVSTNKISAQLSTGGEVIYNSGTNKYLMTFVSGNTKYYANVSAGSTTEQIQNKSYTITAEPTSETYNGNTVYEITSITNYEGDYILPNSGTKLLTDSDIKGLSKYDLALARNEIYARHGRKFQTAEYSNYFSSKSWYSINPNYNYSDDNSNLNEIESKNVSFLLKAERNL